MRGFLKSRRLIAAILLVSVSAGATTLFGQRGGTATAPATTPATTPAAAPDTAVIDPNASIADIAGMPINNKAFYDILMQVAGWRVFQQVYDLVLVQHAMKLSGIPYEGQAFQDLVNKELDLTLEGINSTDPTKPLTREDKLRALDQMLAQQGMTAPEFSIKMQTRAGLRALSAGKNEVSDAEAQQAYEAEYGERRNVVIFVVADDAQAAAVRKEIDAKKTPEEAAREAKLTQAPVALPIPKNTTGIDELKTVIFNLREGQLSNITTLPAAEGQKPQKVLALLQKIEPDRRTANPFKADDIKKRVKTAKEEQWMGNHLQILRADPLIQSQTVIKDRFLKQQHDAILASLREQAARAAAAATQPASTPITTPAPGPATLPAAPTPPAGRGGLGTVPPR